jgi:hypothetical protein
VPGGGEEGGDRVVGVLGSVVVCLTVAAIGQQEGAAGPERPIRLVDLTDKRLQLDKQKLAALGLSKKEVKLPKETRQVAPKIPEGVERASATLDCVVDVEGVPQCRLLRASNAEFGARALAAASASRYSPLLIRGKPHPCAFMKGFAAAVRIP